jgi:hypothetical protein
MTTLNSLKQLMCEADDAGRFADAATLHDAIDRLGMLKAAAWDALEALEVVIEYDGGAGPERTIAERLRAALLATEED